MGGGLAFNGVQVRVFLRSNGVYLDAIGVFLRAIGVCLNTILGGLGVRAWVAAQLRASAGSFR
jgi:hypothetical protein